MVVSDFIKIQIFENFLNLKNTHIKKSPKNDCCILIQSAIFYKLNLRKPATDEQRTLSIG